MPNPIFSIKKASYLSGKDKKIIYINNFQIHRGTVYVIEGNSASGKTTLIDIISRNKKISSGEIMYENEDIYQVPRKVINQELHVVTQINKIPWGTVNSFINKKLRPYKHLNDLEKKINDIARKLKIIHLLDEKVSKLTPSQFRAVLLSIGIIADTKVLIIDELEQHLSKRYINNLSKILYRKANYDGVTIIFTTQNKEMFPRGLTSITITLDTGRISSVRSKSKKNRSN